MFDNLMAIISEKGMKKDKEISSNSTKSLDSKDQRSVFKQKQAAPDLDKHSTTSVKSN